MPLIKSASKKAFKHNVKEEMDAHPDEPKRDLAIAYSMKKKAKKMAMGGEVGEQSDAHEEQMMHQPEDRLEGMGGAGVKGHTIHVHVNPKQKYGEHRGNYAHGGMAEEQPPTHEMDMIDRVMRKKMSKGGMVANQDSGESASDPNEMAKAKPNEFDDLALDDDLEFNYTGENSGDEDGSKLNQDDHEAMIDRVMRRKKK